MTTRDTQGPMMVCVKRPRDLAAEEIQVWNAIQETERYASPFFRPEFAVIAEAAGRNVHVVAMPLYRWVACRR